MLIIGLDCFKEPKYPVSKLKIVLGKRRIGVQINRKISRQSSRMNENVEPYVPHDKRGSNHNNDLTCRRMKTFNEAKSTTLSSCYAVPDVRP